MVSCTCAQESVGFFFYLLVFLCEVSINTAQFYRWRKRLTVIRQKANSFSNIILSFYHRKSLYMNVDL